nr:unnamed protein product [Spirometra erinaceieuropaei]
MSPEVSCSGELEKVIAPKGTIQAAHDTESLYQVSAQLPITQRIEIKVMLTPGRSFKRGDIIVTDTTLVHALSESETANYCAYCVTASDRLLRCSQCNRVYYCGRQCQKAGWAFGHRGECKFIAKTGKFPTATLRLLLALITTGKYKDATIFDSFVSHLEENLRDPETKSKIDLAYAGLMLFSQKTLQISRSDFEVLFCKVKINSFTMVGEHGASIGTAFFRWSSKFDHSCKPNAEFLFIGRTMKIMALEDMEDWTKARISYLDTMIPTEERRKDLQSRYFFHCDCELCEDVEQDLKVRIPICCGKERLMGPRSAAEYLSSSPSRLVAFPPSQLHFLPDLKPHSCLDPEEVFVCGNCDKVYAAPVLEAFQRRVYEIKEYAGALELYKACVAADQNEKLNPYFRLLFRHQDSVLMTRLCRTVIAKCTCWQDREMDEDVDLVLDCGTRTIQWLQSHTNMQYQYICSVAMAYLIFLSNSIFCLQEKLGPLGRPPCHIYNLPRLNRFTEAFLSAAPALVPCIRNYARHIPNVADDLSRLKDFARNLNLKL